MGTEEQFAIAWEKFLSFVREYIQKITVQKAQSEKNIESYTKIEAMKKEPTVDNVLKAQDVLISLDSSLKETIEIIKFFNENNGNELVQAKEALHKILTHPLIQNYQETIANEKAKIKNIDLNIVECEKCLNKESFSFRYLSELIEVSPLSENEKIAVLSKAILDESSKKEREIPAKEEPTVSLKELITTYQNLVAKGKIYKEKYQHLLGNKTPQQMEYIKMITACLHQKEADIQSFQYSEEKMMVLLIEMLEVEEIVATETQGGLTKEVSPTKKEEIEYYVSNLEEIIKEIISLDTERVEEKKSEETELDENRILFFLDEKNRPFFDIEKFSNEEQNRIANLFKSLTHTYESYTRGDRHTKFLTKQKCDVAVFINKNGKMCLSYALLPEETILVLQIAGIKKIFEETEKIVRKYSVEIESYRTANLGALLEEQSNFKQELYDRLNIGKEVRR